MTKQWTPRYTIKIDQDACGNAVECLKCVKTCLDHGSNVLGFMNKETPDLSESIPGSWRDIDYCIISSFMINCDGCGKCVSVCPREAITLTAPPSQEPRAKVSIEDNIIMCAVLKDGTNITAEG